MAARGWAGDLAACGGGRRARYSAVVPANAGTHTPRPFYALGLVSSHKPEPGVMGPCVRRDDAGVVERKNHLTPEQRLTIDLAGAGLRQLGDESDLARILVRQQF